MTQPYRPNRFIFPIIVGLFVHSLLSGAAVAAPENYSQLKSKAELLFAEKSFSLAHKIYQKADKFKLDAKDA